jgi:hypothetical protein
LGATKKGRPRAALLAKDANLTTYWPLFVAFIGAVAEASFEAAFAAMADEFDAAFAEAIAALASDCAAAAELSAVFAALFLQAATETAAAAAPTIRIARSVPEVIFPGPSG